MDKILVLAILFLFATWVHGDSTQTLRPLAMEPLKIGAIRPEGHLSATLERQREGLTGHAEKLYEDIGRSDWLTGEKRGGQFAWERGPYYARGLVALALTLKDPVLMAKAKKWVDAAIASQKPNGDFGPRAHNWWANMLPQWYLRDWADATGDARVVSFLVNYYRHQQREFKTLPLGSESCWAAARAGDELDAVLWLHERTGQAEWLDFARLVAGQGADWTTYYHVGGDPNRVVSAEHKNSLGYRGHIVNFMQGLKFPALKWRLGGSDLDRSAYAAAFDPMGWVMRQCGRPDSMVNGSEPLTDRSASAGTELCAIAERIVSIRTVLAAWGDAAPADDLEDVVYNSLPATMSPDYKGLRYYLMLNQPICVDKGLFFADNGKGVGSNCPGPHSGFGCCRSNWHIAWPKFIQTMWMQKEGGIAAVVHGPSCATMQLACGRVTVREETDYPYSGKVTIHIVEGGGKFPLFVRVPRWAKCADAGTFRRYDRVWRAGDEIEVEFPMEPELSFWAANAVAVRRGPLLYALKMEHDWKKVEKYKVPHERREADDFGGEFPRWEIYPKCPWNYALVLDGHCRLKGARLMGTGRGSEIRVKAMRTEAAGWGFLRPDAPGRAIDPPHSPVKKDVCFEPTTISLVPISETQIRITLFPWIRE